jgi:homoserine O-succinyltransferase/O-acetyltransferase
MPLIIEGGRIPSRWAERRNRIGVIPGQTHVSRPEDLTVALINNMPDPALEDTELQFFELLDIASEDIPVYLKLFSLNGVPRGDRGLRHLNSFYYPFDELWQNHFDGVIVTGTEPHHSDLRDEPYWNLLAEVFEWAQRATSSTILSCLAAHASVLHCDCIKRHPLPDKKFGIFDAPRNSEHMLIRKAGDPVCFPHSRWNEVRKAELTGAGYVVLTESAEAGVDLFVKQMKRSLFVHFQGHPEYGAQTLAKEYKRDIKRFLRCERETYPTMPRNYFCGNAVQQLSQFQENAVSNRCEEMIEFFPESVFAGLERTWGSSAIGVYRNWLHGLASRKAETSALTSLSGIRTTKSAAIIGTEIA